MSVAAEDMTSLVTLDSLLDGETGVPRLPVTGITTDSRQVAPGYVFFACQGATFHGLDFIDQVVASGAVAIVWDASTGKAVDASIPTVAVPELASKIGAIANRWFDSPTSKIKLAGVTGTNGKTTVAYLIAQCLQRLNEKCAYVGTLGSGIEQISAENDMTTPACIELHSMFAGHRSQGANYAAMEVSSHALHQKRVDGISFDTVVFTNLSRDHIDYHGGMRAYGEVKASLFVDFDVAHRIINIDSDFGDDLAVRCPENAVLVSTAMERDPAGRLHVFAQSINSAATGSEVSVTSSWGDAKLDLNLAGEFNVANALQVLAVLLCWDVPLDRASAVLGEVPAPPGRMQRVSVAGDQSLPAVYVDYSHTPASLEVALISLRSHCNGQLWCVFGCGGDRDRGKRPMMGKAANDHADVPIVTSDNPRSEDPAAIIEDVLQGMDDDSTSIADRADAIEFAIRNAASEDTILIAGKGHEHYQVIGKERIRFSDYETAERHLARRFETGASVS